MKRAPHIPPKMPMMMAPGANQKMLMSETPNGDVPNFKDEPAQPPLRFPFKMFYRKANVKQEIEQAMKTFQIIENLQNVLGLDIS